MKNFFKKYQDVLFFLLLPLGACALLWIKSDPPPFGTPLNELSDQCWGIYMDIARQWKTGDFSFWTRSIGGGFCLYTSGFYPIWVPWNAVAKFLSFDQFYLLKMIEPFFIGLMSMAFLLRRGLKLSYPLAAFGALAYNGFIFTRYVGIIHMPFFLWLCAFFPLMIYVYSRLFERHIYLRSVALGAFMSLIFLGGGAGQYAQMIIWSVILLVLDALFFVKEKSLARKMWLALTSCAIFGFFAIAIAGVQILPMAVYTLTESSRTLGEYPINNFPFFRNDYKGNNSISNIFQISIWVDGDHGVRAFWALMIFAFGKLIVDWKAFRQWCSDHKPWLNVVLATVLFFLLPPVAELLSFASPFFGKLFNPLRMFTFGYCGFMIDMVMVVVMVVLLDMKTFTDQQKPAQKLWKQTVLLVFLILAQCYLFSPLWLSQLFPHWQIKYAFVHFSQRYLMMFCLLILAFPLPKAKHWPAVVLFLSLVFIGIQLLQTSYVWGEKGQQTAKEEYGFDTPEHEFYRAMKGRYYLPFVHTDGTKDRRVSMTHNYDLLYEVNGLQGFLNSPPKRMSNFINAYHNRIYWLQNSPAYKFTWRATPASLVTYFPVEFTTIDKGMTLPWPGFSKKIDGVQYDVWVRDEPVAPVRFAKEIRVVSYRELVDSFDRPFEGIIYMTQEDAARFSPAALVLSSNLKQATYEHFERPTPDTMAFDVESPNEVFVLLPEMFQNGWRLKVDGQEQTLFPASSVFMGLFLEKGKHHVELEFRPVLWGAGCLLTAAGIGLLGWIMFSNSKMRRKKR